MKYYTLLVALCFSVQLLGQSIKGKVIDAHTDEVIAFANVSLVDFQLTVRTNEQGEFTINGQFPKQTLIRITMAGYEAYTKQIESSMFITVALHPIHLEMDEVTVTASTNELHKNSVTYVEVKSIAELNEIPKTNIGQMLDQIPGVYNSGTGMGISKPVIRGLQGTRVLTLLNGVRMEGQQWGGDHGMGLSELGIGSIEVIKGPASLMYGADALGGVIALANLPYAHQKEHHVELGSSFESNTMGSTSHVLYNGTTKNFKIMAGGRFATHADYQLPSGDFVKLSRFNEKNAKLGIGWHKGKWVGNIRYDYASSIIGIPGHTHDSVPTKDDFISAVQNRSKSLPVQYLTNHVASWENKFVLPKHVIQVITSFTANKLVEHDEKVTIPGLGINTFNIPYKVSVQQTVNEKLSLMYGVQGMFLMQNNLPNALERLVPNAQQWDNGAYFLAKWKWRDWMLMGGLRADVRQIDAQKDEKFTENFKQNYAGYNFSLGAVYSPAKSHIFRLNASSGFRIPHLSELLSDGMHHGTFRYEVGDRQLKTEKAFQLDGAYEFAGEHLSMIVNPFINVIEDYIFLQAQDSFVGNVQRFHYKQANQTVMLAGADVGFHYHPHFAHIIHFESTFSYLHLFSAQQDAISLVPQPRWTNSIIARFDMKSKVRLDNVVVQYMYYLPQHQVSTFETKSADYGVLDLGLKFSVKGKTNLALQLGVRNLTNTKYINHLSRLKVLGLENPGRNFYVKLIYNLNLKKNETN